MQHSKADWVKFAETLQLNSSESSKLVELEKLVKLAMQTSHLNENSKTYTLLEELAIQFRNLIVNAADQHIPKRKASSKAKVWWSESLFKLRTEMSSFKRI